MVSLLPVLTARLASVATNSAADFAVGISYAEDPRDAWLFGKIREVSLEQ